MRTAKSELSRRLQPCVLGSLAALGLDVLALNIVWKEPSCCDSATRHWRLRCIQQTEEFRARQRPLIGDLRQHYERRVADGFRPLGWHTPDLEREPRALRPPPRRRCRQLPSRILGRPPWESEPNQPQKPSEIKFDLDLAHRSKTGTPFQSATSDNHFFPSAAPLGIPHSAT